MTETNPRPTKIEPIEKHRKAKAHKLGTSLDSIEDALDEYRRGRFVIIVDDEDRENEGDLALAGEFANPEHIAFMLRYTSGVICVPMTGERLDRLHIPMMVQDNQATFGTAFTVSVDAREGVSTGISAADRARAINVLADPDATPHDLVMPGHIYPLRARQGGVLVRAGQTEASIDLCRLAGLQPAAAICELMNPDGTMMRLPHLKRFAARHDLKIISVAELIRYRTQRERLIERAAATMLPTKWGDFTLYAYRSSIDPDEHAAVAGAQWVDVAGHDDVCGGGLGVGQHVDAARAVGRGDAGRHAFAGIYGDGKGCAEGGLVVLHHHRDAQAVQGGAGHRYADHAGGVAEHKGDLLRRREFGGHAEVALVLAVLVVDNDHEAAGAILLDCLLH